MIISIEAEKAFDKSQLPLMIIYLQKVVMKGTYLNIIKATYDNPTENNSLNGEKLKDFFLRNKTRVPAVATVIQHSFGSPSYTNQKRKRNKRNPDWKRRSKTLTVCK